MFHCAAQYPQNPKIEYRGDTYLEKAPVKMAKIDPKTIFEGKINQPKVKPIKKDKKVPIN